MKFNIDKSIEILERTPQVLGNLLGGISEEWTMSNEGADTFSPFDVVGHLIHGEKTDWIPRMEIILSEKADKTFASYDRFAQYEESKGKSMHMLLEEFSRLRTQNISILKSKNLSESDLQKKGIHPRLGPVTLSQLLATWTAHDLGHLAQITRVMAKQYKEAVGPWIEYMGILTRY